MGNRAYIDVFERVNMRTGLVSYMVEVFDDYQYGFLVFSDKNDISEDDMELLKKIIEEKHNLSEQGLDNCEAIEGVLDSVFENNLYINIGDTRYEWDDIKDTISQDIREVFFCPDCGWESYSDGDYQASCGNDDCDGEVSEVRKEWYEK